MRRFLTTLMILLVVLVAGLSALVLMVNPNDFRDYMVREVEARSGYKLALEGPLRWHVWPQLSILSGRMSLKAPGATVPVVSASNMRLDVALLPLLSHRLEVRQVLVKGAVIQLMPQSEAQKVKTAPVAPKTSVPLPDGGRGWSFDIGRLQVIDSLLVFEQHPGEQVTMRNINLKMTQDEKRQAQVNFSGSVNRNQRDLDLQFEADLDGSNYPSTLNANLTSLNYRLQGADLPRQGITGQGQMNAHWQQSSKTLNFSGIKISANDSDLNGEVNLVLGDTPDWDISLSSQRLNFDNLLVMRNIGPVNQQTSQPQARVVPRPVIASAVPDDDLTGLTSFNAQFALSAASTQWRGLQLSNLDARMSNQGGVLDIASLQGKLSGGNFSLPGTINARSQPAQISLAPTLENVDLAPLLAAFNYPQALTGRITMKGNLSGNELDANNFLSQWQGSAEASVSNLRLEGMNFLMLVQQAIARTNDKDIEQQHSDDNATALKVFSTVMHLDHGKLELSDMVGESPLLALTGNGRLDLVKQQCDTEFAIRATPAWKGDADLVAALQRNPLPLRVFGPWQALNYHLDVDRELRKNLQNEAKQRLKNWIDRNKGSQRAKDASEILNAK